ncbi:MAG: protein kinase [Pseudomonadota bacterium]
MSQRSDQAALALFEQLLDLPESERGNLLSRDDVSPALRRQVENMLALDANTDPFLDGDAQTHLDPLLSKAPAPKVLGYDILETLGEGGMATVYRALRKADYQQQVALKVIRPQHLSPLWEKRFLRERQILATLRHPNMAQLVDGGTTSDGHPFLAMEFVNGSSLIRHADQQRLSLEERLGLVLNVCDAVSYAHHQLVIHRDLKPANILVDEHGFAKLLDFGIAKLLDDDPGEAQTVTDHRALTPEYAAPEQFLGNPVSTATDVYALGVITYELLCGRRPFSDDSPSLSRRLNEAPLGFSRKLTHLDAQEREQIAQVRSLSWSRLSARLKGDIQNVVLKALSTEPENRYASVEAMAEDLRRYLEGKPVTARSGSAYRIKRFVTRNRLWLGASALLLAASVAGVLATVHQAREGQREAALAQAVQSFFIDEMLAAARPEVTRGNALGVVEVLEQTAARIDSAFVDEPALQARLRQTTGASLMSLGRYDAAEPLLEQAVDDLRAALGPNQLGTLMARSQLGQLRLVQGRPADAKRLLSTTLAILRDSDPRALLTLVTQGRLAEAEVLLGQWEQAQAYQETALAALKEHHPDAWRERLKIMDGLILAHSKIRNDAQAEIITQQLLALQREKLGNDHPDIAFTMHRLGESARRRSRYAEAASAIQEALAIRRRILGESHPDTLRSLSSLAGISWYQGEYALMEEQLRELLRRRITVLGPEHADAYQTRGHLALALRMQSKHLEAEKLYRETAAFESAAKGETSPDAFRQLRNLQWLLMVSGQSEKALANARRTLEISRKAAADPSISPVRLADFAYWLLTLEPLELRDPKTALKWAQRANESANSQHADVMVTLALALEENGRLNEAFEVIQASAKLPDSLYLYGVERRLVAVLSSLGKQVDADRLLRERLSHRLDVQEADEVMVGWTRLWLGRNRLSMGDAAGAEKELLAAKAQFRRTLPESYRHVWQTNSDLAAALILLGRPQEAEPLALSAYEGLKGDRRIYGPTKRQALRRVIEVYQYLGQADEAARWQQELDEKSKLHDRAIW